MPSRSIAPKRCWSIRLRMSISRPFAPACGSFEATLLVRSLTCLSGRCGLSFSLCLSDDFRIEEHPRGLAFARNSRDENSGVNFSDAMIGAVGDEDAAVFGDGDLLRRVQLCGESFFAVAAEARAAYSGNGCNHASANNADAVVATV